MDYNVILQWYYYNQTGVFPPYPNEDGSKWGLQVDENGVYSYIFWDGPFASPDLADTSIFNETNEALAETLSDNVWQMSKNIILKMVENNYIYFLEEWSAELQGHGIIPPGYKITVDNTDTATNMYYLLVLKNADCEHYERFSSEFLKYKSTIESAGGYMWRVEFHPEIETSSSSSSSLSSSSSSSITP